MPCWSGFHRLFNLLPSFPSRPLGKYLGNIYYIELIRKVRRHFWGYLC